MTWSQFTMIPSIHSPMALGRLRSLTDHRPAAVAIPCARWPRGAADRTDPRIDSGSRPGRRINGCRRLGGQMPMGWALGEPYQPRAHPLGIVGVACLGSICHRRLLLRQPVALGLDLAPRGAVLDQARQPTLTRHLLLGRCNPPGCDAPIPRRLRLPPCPSLAIGPQLVQGGGRKIRGPVLVGVDAGVVRGARLGFQTDARDRPRSARPCAQR